MSSVSFSWLHLSDLHFGLKGQDCLWPNLRQPFLDDLAELHRRTGPWQAVLFTGDLVQQGQPEEFNAMRAQVLERLWERLRELGSGGAVLLAVPGNHDLVRPDPEEDSPAVDALLDTDNFPRLAAKFWDNPAGAYRRVIDDAFAAYRAWWGATPQRPPGVTDGILPGDFACTMEHAGRRIGIVGLNTAFLQLQGGDYKEKLVWDVRQLHAVCGGAADDWLAQHHICLLLTHQGPDWLTPTARRHGESEIAPPGRFAAHLFGHMHETEIVHIRKGGNHEPVRLCQGSSVFGMETFGDASKTQRSHGYSVGRIDFGDDGATLRIWPRIATNKTGPWRFIPDHVNGHLQDDGGTVPEVVAVRRMKVYAAGSATQAVRLQATATVVKPVPKKQMDRAPEIPPEPDSPSEPPPNRPRLQRKPDGEFVAHARAEIARILSECPPLNTEIEKIAVTPAMGGQSDLVDMLDTTGLLDSVVNDVLRLATIACLAGLAQESVDFRKRWEAAREVLAWLAVLSVHDGWVAEIERSKRGFAGIHFEIPVVTEFGVEILSSRYRQSPVSFPEETARADIPGAHRFEVPLAPPSYVLRKELDALVLKIWNQVFPDNSRTALLAEHITRLNHELEVREVNRTEHHYLAFSSETSTPLKDEAFLAGLLGLLPNLAVIRMATSQGNCPLLVSDEYRLLAVVRSFLQLPRYLSRHW